MKVFLLNPPSKNTISSEIPDVVREGGKLPPLGLLYLAGALRRAGHEVGFFDAGNSGATASEAAKRVAAFGADAVGVTATTYQLVDAVQTLREVKTALPSALRLIGGPHVAAFPEETARLPEVDVALVDEADESLPALLQGWRAGEVDPPPAGVLLKRGGGIVRGAPACKPGSIDTLARPDRSLLDKTLYGDVTVGHGPLATLSTSRGCPYACTFCSTPGAPVRLRDAEAVAEEMAELVAVGFSEAYLVDDTFNIDVDRAARLCESLIRRKVPVAWTCRARLDRLTPELAGLMKRAGCTRVQLGVEAATEEALAVLGKNITTDQARQAVAMLRRAGLPSAAYFMIGLPTDRSVADIRHTVGFAVDLDPDYAVFNVLVPYPHTKLYDLAVTRGLLDPGAWPAFAAAPTPGFTPPVWTEFLTTDTLYLELKRAYRRFYLRPRPILRQTRRLRPHNVWAIVRRAVGLVGGG
jgi:radical SAM superfamily enzyme YgiQ (UPF0313 family)